MGSSRQERIHDPTDAEEEEAMTLKDLAWSWGIPLVVVLVMWPETPKECFACVVMSVSMTIFVFILRYRSLP